jgi:hypothetical protein
MRLALCSRRRACNATTSWRRPKIKVARINGKRNLISWP